MNTTDNLINSMKYVGGKNEISNESLLDIYLHIRIIAETEIWKEDSFYEGAPKKFHVLKTKTFAAFIKEVYSQTHQWYRSMESFLALPNGKDLYIKYGHKNLASFMAFSPSERKQVLALAPKYPTSTFLYILNQTGARGTKKESIKNASESEWKRKYQALLKKYNTLKGKYDSVQEENKELKKKVNRMSRVFETA